MPTHFSIRTFDRFLMNQDGGLPGIPGSGSGQPGPPSFEKQPTPQPPMPGSQPLPGSQLPGMPPPGTPVFEQAVPPPLPPAGGGTFELSGWWRRVGATVIDSLILSVPFFVIFVALLGVSVDGSGDANGFSIGALIITTLAWVVLWFVYAPLLMAKTNGATIGKKACGIRVVRTDGAPITFGFAAVREVAIKALLIGLVSNLTLGLGGLLNYLWPLWDSEHRALHDMLAKTRVVRG
ncbi:MAG: RDD family protein [Solirubrobacteraceae bacterium]|nr:RDD family protein [Solirubrobacteraceae bacterium]